MIRYAVAALVLVGTLAVQAQEAAPPPPPKMPLREITVFKDGHSLLLHEGVMPLDDAGHVVLDGLPNPVMGSFWSYSADPAATLSGVVAGQRTLRVERDATTLLELLQANKGAQVTITLRTRETLTGVLTALNGNLVFVRTLDGLRPLPFETIDQVTFRDKSETRLTGDETRASLTLRLDWAANPRPKAARVGMMYLQKGIRWIPSYKIEIDGKGHAKVQLKATLINELTDLDNVDAHLVVGVPSFAFKDTPDPISLQKAVAQLSRHFQQEGQTAYAFGNAIYSQASRASEVRRQPEAPAADAGQADPDAREDVFIFPVKKLSLKKGEVLVLPVAEFKVDYKDVYAIDIPMTPPQEALARMHGREPSEADRLFHAPKAIHKIRLMNTTPTPITTAPALILQDGRLLAQGMTTYTSSGGSSDVEITTAIDIQVKKTESEKSRTPNALRWNDTSFNQVKLEGKICLTNYRKAPVEVEVTRVVLGEVAQPLANGGTVEKVNLMEDSKGLDRQPYYSYWYSSWWWWNKVNPVSRITWKATLEPGKSTDLEYAWSHYWQY
ncbi:MAG TPA: hypothetical protein VM222_07495 [Planctomycetota bacterium]|nr:hypothetical protein [Planctomycetota bacterium]